MENKKLLISWNKVKYLIEFNNIEYIERLDRITYIYTDNHRIYKTSQPLDLLEKQLPENFIRIHKSYFVNANYIKVLKANEIIIEDGVSIPISRSRSKATKNALYQLLGYK